MPHRADARASGASRHGRARGSGTRRRKSTKRETLRNPDTLRARITTTGDDKMEVENTAVENAAPIVADAQKSTDSRCAGETLANGGAPALRTVTLLDGLVRKDVFKEGAGPQPQVRRGALARSRRRRAARPHARPPRRAARAARARALLCALAPRALPRLRRGGCALAPCDGAACLSPAAPPCHVARHAFGAARTRPRAPRPRRRRPAARPAACSSCRPACRLARAAASPAAGGRRRP